MDPSRWEHFEHESDIGVRGIGPTVSVAFEQAALALTAVVSDPCRVMAVEEIAISCREPDLELLFLAWLDAVIYEMAVRRMLFSRFSVQIDDDRLSARIAGEQVDVARHEPAVEVKGATLCALRVEKSAGHWIAQCVLDV